MQKDKQDLEDAGDELLMQDDERVKFSLGDCFVYLSPDEVEERLGKVGAPAPTSPLPQPASGAVVSRRRLGGCSASNQLWLTFPTLADPCCR